MKVLFCLPILFFLSPLFGLAQTCEQLSRKADKFYTISDIDDYELYKTFKSEKELISNLDSAIYYKERL